MENSKDFDGWNTVKKELNKSQSILNFHEGGLTEKFRMQ